MAEGGKCDSLEIHWGFGFSKDKIGSIQSLCGADRNAIFLMSGHSGIIYDFEHRKQCVLQGHCNIITCCAVDKSNRWIITADAGKESIMVVWDSLTQLPVKTYVLPHSDGVSALTISDDGNFIATLSHTDPIDPSSQEIAIWSWTTTEEAATIRTNIGLADELFHSISFNPSKSVQLVTTGKNSVSFWDWDNFALESYHGKVSKADLGHISGEYTASVFLPETEIALTSTSQGYMIVWEKRTESMKSQSDKKASMKTAVKAVKLLDCGINFVTLSPNQYLVLGCADGAVRFYDFYLRLEAWFEDLNAGPVTSVSFSIQSCPFPFTEAGHPGLRFWVPDFIVGTKDAFVVGVESRLFDEVRKEDRRGTLLMQGLSGPVMSIACHPNQPLVAFFCKNGAIQLWNYEMKLLINIREFFFSRAAGAHDGPVSPDRSLQTAGKQHVYATLITFNPEGTLLAVSFSNGVVKLLNTSTLQDVQTFSCSLESINHLRFSLSGNYLAASDEEHHVILFSKEVEIVDAYVPTPNKPQPLSFIYVGRAVSHTARIVGLEFGFKENTETLISIGEDRYCVEYDLNSSSIENGLKTVGTISAQGSTLNSVRLESFAKPTCLFWPQRNEMEMEDRFIIANTEFKFKEFNLESKQCRKTCLAPRYGFPVCKVAIFPQNYNQDGTRQVQGYAFATDSKVIGVGRFPLNGDPAKSNATIAHPGEITSIAVSNDALFVFSAGGADLSVNMWIVAPPQDQNNDHTGSALDLAIAGAAKLSSAAEADLPQNNPFINLLEGGYGGELHQNLTDYFYYAQLRHGGEDTTEVRHLTGQVPLEEIPALVRSVGYYPSEEEVIDMINEIRYKQFVITGDTQDFIGLEELIQLYVNHRPVIPLERHMIQNAFDVISNRLGYGEQGAVHWSALMEALTNEGEKIDQQDLDTYLGALIGDSTAGLAPDEILDGRTFATRLLGFEMM